MNATEIQGLADPESATVFGGVRLAYIKAIGAADAYARGLIPQDAAIPNDTKLFMVNSADGTPLAISDSWAGAYGAALQNALVPLSVH